MNETMLINPQSAGMPAPIWFVQFFKALGFTLHMVPMNLWFAGLLLALWLHWRGGPHGRCFAGRLIKQMPVIVALGVNFGIVPLLFIQLAYYKVFYPATILMAWYWLAIVVLLIPAYYGIYIYAWGLAGGPGARDEGRGTRDEDGERGASAPCCLPAWRIAAGWISMCLFLTIGFLFTNGLSLMEHVSRWPELWAGHNEAGAALGTALNIGDPTLWPRWLLMFGLALGTTAVWIVFDAEWLAWRVTDESYRRWAWKFASMLYTVALLWTAAVGSWYVFDRWPAEVYKTMFKMPLLPLTLATGAAMGLPWATMLAAARWCPAKHRSAALLALLQLGVLGVNAVSRQTVQNLNLLNLSNKEKPYLDVWNQPLAVQWSPLWMFLIAFVLGAIVVAWMLWQVRRCGQKDCSSI
jgi:hypothetical protein